MRVKATVKGWISFVKKKELVPIIQNSNSKFNKNVALIAGGSGGIGLAIAKNLLESGCKVIIAGTNKNKLENIKQSISNSNLETMILDYSDSEQLENTIAKASNIFGAISIFVSSVGVHTENVDFWNMTPSEYDRVMNINLKGTFFACQSMGKIMKASIQDNKIENGHILLISSSRGSEPAWSPYGLSKWGLKGFTQGLAQQLLPCNIYVNTIAPGSTATELIGIQHGDNIGSEENGEGRLIMPEEVAGLAAYLVSDAGNMIVGETIHISGGRGVFDIR